MPEQDYVGAVKDLNFGINGFVLVYRICVVLVAHAAKIGKKV